MGKLEVLETMLDAAQNLKSCGEKISDELDKLLGMAKKLTNEIMDEKGIEL